jgi:predicted small integral membrane protein
MARRSSTRPIPVAVLAASLATLLLGGCALIQPPPVPQMPRLGLRSTRGDAMCVGDISQAHAALAAAGAAAGDPAATAAAHAAAASAMAAYHACLAQASRP